jgi:hypothetical protein
MDHRRRSSECGVVSTQWTMRPCNLAKVCHIAWRPTGWSPRNCARHIQKYVTRGDFRIDSGQQAMKSLLTMTQPPDAAFIANNLMAIGAIEALRDAGITPPQFGLISFGDLPWARLLNPRLSAISQPAYQLGWSAAEILQDRIAGRQSPTRTIVLNTELIERESTARNDPPIAAPDTPDICHTHRGKPRPPTTSESISGLTRRRRLSSTKPGGLQLV